MKAKPSSKTTVSVGPALGRLRRERKLMRRTVARKLKTIGFDRLRHWETGKEEPSHEEIGLVLEVLNAGYDDLARVLAMAAQEELREQSAESRTDLKKAIATFSGQLAGIEAAYDKKVVKLFAALDELEKSLKA